MVNVGSNKRSALHRFRYGSCEDRGATHFAHYTYATEKNFANIIDAYILDIR